MNTGNSKEKKMITKSELIEYLKHTPENTNYNILYSSLYNGSNKEVVDEFIDVLSRGNSSLAALQPYLAKLYEDDKTISPDPLPPFSSGSGSVPKPLTYDYMPEGYPTKSVQTTTLMEEQELAFADGGGMYMANLANGFKVAVGQTYIVNWDGTEYECAGGAVDESLHFLGNISIAGESGDTGEPFMYIIATGDGAIGQFMTLETSASHTISVKRIEEIVTPMAEEFLPAGGSSGSSSGQFIVVVYNTNVAGTEFAADKTYDEISAAIESGMSVVIHKKKNINAANYDVFHHNQTGPTFYKFCRVYFGNTIEVWAISIRMVDGKMVIDIQSKEIQVLTS